MITAVHPYLNFAGDAAEAIALYTEALGAEVVESMRWGQMPSGEGEVPPGLADKIIHAQLRIGQGAIMLNDVPPQVDLSVGNNVHVILQCDAPADVDRIYAKLVEGGEPRMPPGDTFWNARYAELVDRFGVGWKLNHQRGR
ncbi:MAG: VOC family protein [Nannocystaceae bacterium]